MSKYIDPNKPLSDEDRAYLEEWSRQAEIISNDLRFGGLSQEEKDKATEQANSDSETDAKIAEQLASEPELDFDEDIIEEVAAIEKTADLRLRLQKLGQSTEGDREDLVERLLNALQDQRDAESSE